MMLAVRSHAYAKLIQLARRKFKIFWVKLLAEESIEKIFEYVKDHYGSPSRGSRNLSAPAVNFVIFMAQRPTANIALLKADFLSYHPLTIFTIEISRQNHGCEHHLTDFF